MNNIIEPTINYDFSNIYLGPPSNLSGGAYFTRIMYDTNKQLFIQTPKSLTKQGFIKSGKKIYVDLMFDNNDTIFINWIENLETRCQELMFEKSEQWFETKIEKDDIESAFTSPFKIYKSGKFYLLRVNVKPNIKIYNEIDTIVNMDDITPDKNIISILEIQGIKFTSRNFQIEIELKQSMIVSPDPFLDECFIKKPIKKQNKENENENISEKKTEQNIDAFIKESANQISQTLETNVKFKSEPISITNDNDNDNETLPTSMPHIENNNTISDEPINLEIEDLDINKNQEQDNSLKEIDLASNLDNNLETITLKKPNQVYYEIYQKAREKAKAAKKLAINAYLELKQIKKTYMLDDIDESDDSELDNLDENSDHEESDSDADIDTEQF
jgi:hypothetical protein